MPDRPDAHPSPSQSPSRSTLTGVFLRAWWIVLGNGLLGLVLVVLAMERQALPSWLDGAFVALVGSLLAARFADIRYFDGCTAEGDPATMQHFRSYALRLLAGSTVVWGSATSVALL